MAMLSADAVAISIRHIATSHFLSVRSIYLVLVYWCLRVASIFCLCKLTDLHDANTVFVRHVPVECCLVPLEAQQANNIGGLQYI